MGIFINNRFGYYDWVSETQVVKQSIGSFVGMFGGLIVAVIPALLIGTATISNYRVFTFAVITVLTIITIFLYKNESRRSINKEAALPLKGEQLYFEKVSLLYYFLKQVPIFRF